MPSGVLAHQWVGGHPWCSALRVKPFAHCAKKHWRGWLSVCRTSAYVPFRQRQNVQRSRRQVRLSRALGIALTPKAQRIFEKRPYAPGEHGRTRRRTESDYAVRLREKQRLRAQYGISEKQLRAAYEKGTHTAGQTGNAMLTDLETRLDALVLRAGFARTTAQARQFVVHRHILVDGNIVDRPSYRVKPGQTIQVKAKSQTMVPFQAAAEGVHRDVLPAVPGYLDVNLPSLKATLTRKPEAEEIPVQVNIQYVVEFYAR